jgi:hypothetical protein
MADDMANTQFDWHEVTYEEACALADKLTVTSDDMVDVWVSDNSHDATKWQLVAGSPFANHQAAYDRLHTISGKSLVQLGSKHRQFLRVIYGGGYISDTSIYHTFDKTWLNHMKSTYTKARIYIGHAVPVVLFK